MKLNKKVSLGGKSNAKQTPAPGLNFDDFLNANSGKDAKGKQKVSHSRVASNKASSGKQSLAAEPGAKMAAPKTDGNQAQQAPKVEEAVLAGTKSISSTTAPPVKMNEGNENAALAAALLEDTAKMVETSANEP